MDALRCVHRRSATGERVAPCVKRPPWACFTSCDVTHLATQLRAPFAANDLFCFASFPVSSSALEELRAAHNLISQVPASLGKNVALRTLDLGHNNIEGWGALERVGKTLKSLVQVTLAGNPLCVDDSPGMLAVVSRPPGLVPRTASYGGT